MCVKCESHCSQVWRHLGATFISNWPPSLSEVHKHTLLENAEVKGNLSKAQTSIKDAGTLFLERLSKFALTWECGETFEGLVRETCPAVTSMCFKLGISQRHTLTHQLIPGHVHTCIHIHHVHAFYTRVYIHNAHRKTSTQYHCICDQNT